MRRGATAGTAGWLGCLAGGRTDGQESRRGRVAVAVARGRKREGGGLSGRENRLYAAAGR